MLSTTAPVPRVGTDSRSLQQEWPFFSEHSDFAKTHCFSCCHVFMTPAQALIAAMRCDAAGALLSLVTTCDCAVAQSYRRSPAATRASAASFVLASERTISLCLKLHMGAHNIAGFTRNPLQFDERIAGSLVRSVARVVLGSTFEACASSQDRGSGRSLTLFVRGV